MFWLEISLTGEECSVVIVQIVQGIGESKKAWYMDQFDDHDL